jgi:hypothetical protein
MVTYEKRGYIKVYNDEGNLISKVRKTEDTVLLVQEDEEATLFGDE